MLIGLSFALTTAQPPHTPGAGSAIPGNAILTEGGDPVTTEAGDTVVTEN